jgi:glycosyltransferase involved in cell wall biosynthesis
LSAISIVIPVLNRPHRAAQVTTSIFAHSQVEVEVFFVCSPGDDAEIEACRATGEEVIVVPWECGPGDFARKHNLAFQYTSAPYVFLGADDLDFQPDWDLQALAVAERSGAGVIGTQDDANPLVKRGRHSTHSLVSRRYIDEVGGTWHDGPGLVFHEGYAHQWVDTELCQASMARGEWAFAHRSIVRHLHPMYPHKGIERTPMDDTYRKALEDGRADGMIFKERQSQAKQRR